MAETPLLYAVKLCNLSAIKSFLKAKINILHPDSRTEGITALKLVLESDRRHRLSVIELFADHLKKCRLNANELAPLILEAGWPIHYAMYIENSEIIKLMLEAGCPVNSRDEGDLGFTALHLAVLNSDVESVKILLQYGADTDIICGGSTPFVLAFPRANVLETFLDSRPLLLDRFNTDGMIDSFRVFSLVDSSVINLLVIKYKINLTVKNRQGNSLLHALVNNTNSEVINLLSETNFDVNIRNNHGDTLLHSVVGYSHINGIQMLLDKGANINAKNENGDTPLINAIFRSATYQELHILIENGTISNEDAQNLILKKVLEKNISAGMITPILKRMAIMHVQGKVSRENLHLLSSISNANRFFDQYLRDLHILNNCEITENSHITLFDIACASELQLLNYARNEDIVNNFFNYKTRMFSILGIYIEKRFELAIIKQNLIQGAINTLSKNIKQLDRNLNIIENIVKFFKPNDLQRLTMKPQN